MKCIFNPLDCLCTSRSGGNSNYIKPAGKGVPLGMLLQVMLGSYCQAGLFAGIDTFRWTSVTTVIAITYLDEEQGVIFTHYQVYFSAATGIVSFNKLEALLLEVITGKIFRRVAG